MECFLHLQQILPSSHLFQWLQLSGWVYHLHTCTQASRSQSISFEDPHQSWKTIFELNLRVSYLRRLTGATELATKPSLGLICCQWDCMATAPCPIPRLVRNNLGMDPRTSISRMTALKHMTTKTIMILMNSLKPGCHGWSLELIKQYCFTKKHRVCCFLKIFD